MRTRPATIWVRLSPNIPQGVMVHVESIAYLMEVPEDAYGNKRTLIQFVGSEDNTLTVTEWIESIDDKIEAAYQAASGVA